MELTIDPQVLETIDAIWATPFGVAAKLLFWFGIALVVVLLVTRQKMSIPHALLALVGLKKVPKRDVLFNLLVGTIIFGFLGLMFLSIQVVIGPAG